jgi:hypothetical protein
MDTATSNIEISPEKLSLGTVIQGIISMRDGKYNVEITIGADAPSISPEKFLCLVQDRCSLRTDRDFAVSGKVTVSNLILPKKDKPLKATHKTHYKFVNGTETSTKEEQTRKRIRKLLSHIGL